MRIPDWCREQRPLLPVLVRRCDHPLDFAHAAACWHDYFADADTSMPACGALMAGYGNAVALAGRTESAAEAVRELPAAEQTLVREIVESEPAGRLLTMNSVFGESVRFCNLVDAMNDVIRRAGMQCPTAEA